MCCLLAADSTFGCRFWFSAGLLPQCVMLIRSGGEAVRWTMSFSCTFGLWLRLGDELWHVKYDITPVGSFSELSTSEVTGLLMTFSGFRAALPLFPPSLQPTGPSTPHTHTHTPPARRWGSETLGLPLCSLFLIKKCEAWRCSKSVHACPVGSFLQTVGWSQVEKASYTRLTHAHTHTSSHTHSLCEEMMASTGRGECKMITWTLHELELDLFGDTAVVQREITTVNPDSLKAMHLLLTIYLFLVQLMDHRPGVISFLFFLYCI